MDPQILKSRATPEICHLQANSTLGPEESGFHLTDKPECYYVASLAQPGSQAPAAHSKAEGTICFTCSDIYHCDPLPCTEDRNYCLQMAGVAALGKDNCVAWTNYSCVAFNDCTFDNFISTLMYSIGFGFWINITCCQGNCQEPPPLATLPASRTLSTFLCPTYPGGHSGPCNHSFYMQCPSGETECVQMNLVSEEGKMGVIEPECTWVWIQACLGLGVHLYHSLCVAQDK